MKLVCLGGFLDGFWGMPSMERDMAGTTFNGKKPVVVRAPNYLHNWSTRTDGFLLRNVPFEPYVVLGFSDGASAAVRLMNQDVHCAGLIFISGIYEEANANRKHVPALILNYYTESKAIKKETNKQWNLMDRTKFSVEKKQTMVENPGWFPHLSGITNHFANIASWSKDQGWDFNHSHNL